jgi:hypothetical protein
MAQSLQNCRFLELLAFVEIRRVDKEESASGVASYRVRITEDGLKVAKKILRSMKT